MEEKEICTVRNYRDTDFLRENKAEAIASELNAAEEEVSDIIKHLKQDDDAEINRLKKDNDEKDKEIEPLKKELEEQKKEIF